MPDAHVTVLHQIDQNRFCVELEQKEAILEYRLIKQNSEAKTPDAIDFTHTWVPQEFRGKGIAEKLVREGLKWARDQQLIIHASCWYVAKFLRSHS